MRSLLVVAGLCGCAADEIVIGPAPLSIDVITTGDNIALYMNGTDLPKACNDTAAMFPRRGKCLSEGDVHDCASVFGDPRFGTCMTRVEVRQANGVAVNIGTAPSKTRVERSGDVELVLAGCDQDDVRIPLAAGGPIETALSASRDETGVNARWLATAPHAYVEAVWGLGATRCLADGAEQRLDGWPPFGPHVFANIVMLDEPITHVMPRGEVRVWRGSKVVTTEIYPCAADDLLCANALLGDR